MRKRTNPLYKMNKVDLAIAMSESSSISDMFSKLGVPRSIGSSYDVLRKLCKEYSLQDEFNRLKERSIAKTKAQISRASKRFELKDILVEGSKYAYRSHIKNRLIKEGLLDNRCNICGIAPEWNNKSLVFVLDHINGVYNDNRLDNLQLVCPNCNSQLPTFAGRNKKYKH